MSHFENSGSEDGQLRSPGDYDFMSEEGETADSLDIKPPQASREHNRKKSGTKDKKHSREHRHKDRDRLPKDRDKERQAAPSEDTRRHYHSGGSSLNREREKRNHHREHRGNRHEYYVNRHKERDRDKRMERDLSERDRRKKTDYDLTDSERVLEDLRTRLISKRYKYEKEAARYDEAPHYELGPPEVKRDRRDNLVELIDSPEHYLDYASSSKRKIKKNSEEDEELAARREKLLEADRLRSRARVEVEARREQRRGRDEVVTPPEYKSGKSKRHQNIFEEIASGHKRLKKSPKELGEYNDKIVVEVSDQTEESSEEEGEHGNSDSVSRSPPSHSNESEKEDNKSGDEDEVLPGSPLSIGNLTKSDHRRRSHSRSRSHSDVSRSCSHSDRSKSHHSLSRSRSRSRSPSARSITKSRSQSRTRSKSQSESPTSDIRKSNNGDGDGDDHEMMDIDLDSESTAKKSATETDRDGGSGEGAIDVEKDKGDNSPCDEKGEKLPNYFPGIQGCRSVEEFQCLNRIEEGTYGVVYRAKDKRTNEIVALKRLKMEKEKEGFPITSLREINTLLKGQHPNIVTVREIVVGSNIDKIFIVMDYVEHDLKSLMETMKHKEQSFFPGEVKCLVQQLLRAVAHLHDNWILHRDLKTSNLLLSHKGILKVGDFGLAREYGSPLKAYTSLVVTLWYRAPELLLCGKEYSTPIDMWSVGCIFAEFLQMGPLFPGKSEIDQLNRIFKELGTPNEKIWPGYKDLPAVQSLLSQNSHFAEYPVSNLRRRFLNRTSELGYNLLQGLLTYDPKQRLTAEAALKTPYFKELPLPIDPSMFPTWPAKSELGARKALASSPKPPSGGGQFKQLGRDDIPANSNNQTGFVLTAGIDKRQLPMGPGFNLKF